MTCEGASALTNSGVTFLNGSVTTRRSGSMRASAARISRGLEPMPSMVLSTSRIILPSSSHGLRRGGRRFGNCRIRLETIQVSIERADVDAAIEHRGRGIDVVADLYFGNLFSVIGGQHVNPTRFVP